ncbi:MAG TPA: hypothetical protein VHM20_03440, partial [Gammaproteobacteria bacterium]|nr:hypothetical protein [Gammaproteobacteria bacterium]
VGKNFYWHSALLDQSSRRKDVDGYESDSDSDDGTPWLGEDRDNPNTLSKVVTHDKTVTQGDLILYALKNPISFIWKLAWPTKNQIIRGWGDFVVPLRFAHILFYGLTTCFEAGLRGFAALLLKPFNNALLGKNRLIGFTIGLPLGLIGQVAIFFANTLEHARFVGDALFNIIPSVLCSFFNGYGTSFPKLGACFGSFFRNLPFLILDAIVIAACFVPGGQLFTFLGSLGNTAAASVFSGFMTHIVIPIGNFLGASFFAPLANNFIVAGMSEYGAQFLAATILVPVFSFFQNIVNSLLEEIKDRSFFKFPKIKKKFLTRKENVSNVLEADSSYGEGYDFGSRLSGPDLRPSMSESRMVSKRRISHSHSVESDVVSQEQETAHSNVSQTNRNYNRRVNNQSSLQRLGHFHHYQEDDFVLGFPKSRSGFRND